MKKQKNGEQNSRLEKLEKDFIYDLIVIGGGISGANIFWDGVLRGLDCVLFEKFDYASGTSQATSKLIHGGLRYLKNAEISLVKESLDERKILAKLTPHSIRPLGFLIPVYDYKNKYLLKIGLSIYDFLSLGRNSELSTDSVIPGHEFLNKERTMTEDSNIPRADLLGSLLYYDYANINPERHTCDFIFSAVRRGGKAFNYISVKTIEYIDGIYNLRVFDSLSQKETIVKSRTVVNSSGPWADEVDRLAIGRDASNLIRSKGIHIVTRNISQKHCSIRITKNKKHLFVIPWRGRTIIGTTDTEYNSNPDEFTVKRPDIISLMQEINEYLNFKIEERDIYYYYGGMRPLVDEASIKSGGTYNVSRKTEITDYKDAGRPGYFTALGGKYTTSRNLAEKTVDRVCDILYKGKACSTKTTRLISGNFSDISTLLRDVKTRYGKVSEEKAHTLIMRYGSQVYEIAELNKDAFFEHQSGIRIDTGEEYYPEEIDFICKMEDVIYPGDFYFRRSGIGNIGKPEEMSFAKINTVLSKVPNLKFSKSDLEAISRRYEF